VGEGFHIGKIARETGLTSDAIRFYEKVGLLKEPLRGESGFRIYGQSAVSDLKFIRKARERGFTLEEIRELRVLRLQKTEACAHVKSLVRRKRAGVRTKRRELQAMERRLSQDLVECQRALKLGHTGRIHTCPLLAKLEESGDFAARAADMT
jgi:MerR family copper efflux transcriptional regulator